MTRVTVFTLRPIGCQASYPLSVDSTEAARILASGVKVVHSACYPTEERVSEANFSQRLSCRALVACFGKRNWLQLSPADENNYYNLP